MRLWDDPSASVTRILLYLHSVWSKDLSPCLLHCVAKMMEIGLVSPGWREDSMAGCPVHPIPSLQPTKACDRTQKVISHVILRSLWFMRAPNFLIRPLISLKCLPATSITLGIWSFKCEFGGGERAQRIWRYKFSVSGTHCWSLYTQFSFSTNLPLSLWPLLSSFTPHNPLPQCFIYWERFFSIKSLKNKNKKNPLLWICKI